MSIKTDIQNQETAKYSGNKWCEWWKNYVQIIKEDVEWNVWAAETGCTSSVFYTKTNASTVVENHCQKKNNTMQKRI
jgi:hypothetical protein